MRSWRADPIRLHPDRPNNYNPIYEDDYVTLGIKAMEVAGTPPVVVNWAGSETVSVEEYCTYMGELVGVDPIFEYTAEAHPPLWPDVTRMHEVLGRTTVSWRDGFRRMIEARHPEITLPQSVRSRGGSMQLPGTPSDEVAEVLVNGDGDITTLFVSMARRHPDGSDADYLRWHTLDHRPEQHRLSAVRASLRLVSTPTCRAARAAAETRYARHRPRDDVLLQRSGGDGTVSGAVQGARRCGPQTAVAAAGRARCVRRDRRTAAKRIKAGADVLPWWPVRGVYLLLEQGSGALDGLVDVDGVAGAWTATSLPVEARLASAPAGQNLTYCFLDDDPIAVAERLRSVLPARWDVHGIEPLFAAPFHAVVPYEWDRYVP